MRNLLCYTAISLVTSTTAFSSDAPVEQALSNAKYDGLTDGLDMQGGGITFSELKADEVFAKVAEYHYQQQSKTSPISEKFTDPVFKLIAQQELGRLKDYTNLNIINYFVDHVQPLPLIAQINFKTKYSIF